MMTPEGKVKNDIKVWLKANEVYFFCPQGGRFAWNLPDLVGCFAGQFFAIEVKAPGKKYSGLTPLQGAILEQIQCAGGKILVTDSLKDFIEWFDNAFLKAA